MEAKLTKIFNMNSKELFLALSLAGCAADRPEAESTPIPHEDPDGTGGGEVPEPRPSDEELINRIRNDVYVLAVDDMLLSDYRGGCRLDFNPAEEDAAQAWSAGSQLNMVDLFTVENDSGAKWSVVSGLLEDCDSFSRVEEIRDPEYVATPYNIDRLEGEGRYDVSFEYGNGSAYGEYGVVLVPFTYDRSGDTIDVNGAVRNPVIGCVEDGELRWIEEL